MAIPKTRRELLDQLVPAWQKLEAEIESAGPDVGDLPCVDDWSIKDLLAVRVWWTGSVIDWIEAWKEGESPVTPKEGYKWQETPRLNSDIVSESKHKTYEDIVKQLKLNYYRIITTIKKLDEPELVDVGHFPQAGRYPVCRWISINTTRQYLTARTFIRKAVRTA